MVAIVVATTARVMVHGHVPLDNRQRYQAGLPLIATNRYRSNQCLGNYRIRPRGLDEPERWAETERLSKTYVQLPPEPAGQTEKPEQLEQPTQTSQLGEVEESQSASDAAPVTASITEDPFKKYLDKILKRVHGKRRRELSPTSGGAGSRRPDVFSATICQEDSYMHSDTDSDLDHRSVVSTISPPSDWEDDGLIQAILPPIRPAALSSEGNWNRSDRASPTGTAIRPFDSAERQPSDAGRRANDGGAAERRDHEHVVLFVPGGKRQRSSTRRVHEQAAAEDPARSETEGQTENNWTMARGREWWPHRLPTLHRIACFGGGEGCCRWPALLPGGSAVTAVGQWYLYVRAQAAMMLCVLYRVRVVHIPQCLARDTEPHRSACDLDMGADGKSRQRPTLERHPRAAISL
ncbi:hypothetical protein CMQ_7570 [Grosmannia clavigera kw1407]|uniref:Uncharacterized protein n=1 Tax=Grosmannia clavigera (strain kw1407 / UAMH 11150) TaxID=655863 RepID=F0XQH6_GROCL|nr:uncharacterized protein CMQ_7570 [Grosmannia clavigera kw1407]EFX00568.1 hypothetical protein CMQ_7570 [Grosmannia clavigera kw1407]